MLRLVAADSSAENINQKSDRDIVLAVCLERRLQREMQMSARVHVSEIFVDTMVADVII